MIEKKMTARCGICDIDFDNIDEVRSHFNSDAHKTRANIAMHILRQMRE